MNKLIAVACLASLYVASGAGAQAAGSYGEPLLNRNSPFSVQFENVVNSVLGPLDNATRPINDLVRPATGVDGFAGSASTDPTQAPVVEGPANDTSEHPDRNVLQPQH